MLLLVGLALPAAGWAAQSADGSPTTVPPSSPGQRTAAEMYHAWVFVPPAVTILLAIWLRQVIPALAVGVLAAGCMAWPCASGDARPAGGPLIGGLRLAVENYLVGALSDTDHVKIVIFTLTIGGMVGIIAANGGTAAIVDVVARWASTRRRGQLATWLAGMVVFFDDYASAMIVGPAMRPLCDRLRISRAKLAYLVDSTAAPVASLAFIGTWIGAEVGFIQTGLNGLTPPPSFLTGFDLREGFAYQAFLSSIPYRFYPILALALVVLIGLLDRDFGPMLPAERQAAVQNADPGNSPADRPRRGRAWHAGAPVLLLVAATLGLLIATGWLNVRNSGRAYQGVALAQQIVSNGDAYNSILYGALAAIVLAAGISLVTRTLGVSEIIEAATAAMGRMFPTMVVLVLAWSMSATMQDLELGQVACRLLRRADFDARWLPLLIFLASCAVSFSTGTSWGTMGILCPAAVTIAAGLLADRPADQAQTLFYASVGAVLGGAVFGDHCSPISDTTVLSSAATGCSLEAHVWTQAPYALLAAGVSVLCGDLLCRGLELPWWAGLAAGVGLLAAIVRFLGRRPQAGEQRLAGQG